MRSAGVALMALSLAGLAAPRADLWEHWAEHGTASARIDHSAWALFLERHVRPDSSGVHRIPYGRVRKADRAALAQYLERLQAVPIREYPRDEQRAYWINLYNAATVSLVLEHYPVESITRINISPGLFTRGPWKRKWLSVEGEPVSLDDIEHRILRPIWQDPRLHYALNCASLGCPNLPERPFTADTAEALLEQAARAYVNHPRGARVAGGRLHVSSIYVWFREDFGGSDAAVIDHLRYYAQPALAKQLLAIRRITDHHYDWALNDLP